MMRFLSFGKKLVVFCGLAVCLGGIAGQCATATSPSTVTRAKAVIKPSTGQRVKGVVSFEAVENGVRIVADFEGLTPGKHGLHIHEKGECGSDGNSAGAHYNPFAAQHGSPDATIRHVGDLGNVVADSKGNAHYERIDRLIHLNGTYSIIGRSILIHAQEDDYRTQPAGNSGDRIGCGTIQAVNP